MTLPVEPDRLRREFPNLTDEDVDAYISLTRRILESSVKDRARVTREVVAGGRAAREKMSGGGKLSAEENLLARYLTAVDKMQRSTTRRA
jgi:hypothetical protein